jgi:hypothetical protein
MMCVGGRAWDGRALDDVPRVGPQILDAVQEQPASLRVLSLCPAPGDLGRPPKPLGSYSRALVQRASGNVPW